MNKRREQVPTLDMSEVVLNIIKVVFITAFMIVCIYPFYYVIIYSISDPSQVVKGLYLLPKGWSLATYWQLFQKNNLIMAFFISISRTVIGTGLCILCTSILAFMMTRKEMLGRKIIYRFVIITMYFNAGIVPSYFVMKAYHLNNNFLLYVIPWAINAYYMILIKTYMEQLPESLEEAAAIEGAGIFDILFRVVLPIAKPIMATVTVYCAVGQWNSWQDNFLLVNDNRLQTVQLILYNYLNSADSIVSAMKSGGVGAVNQAVNTITPQSVRMTAIVVSVLPIMMVYPFAQKYFTKGIMMGAIKG